METLSRMGVWSDVKAVLESGEITMVNAHLDAGWRLLRIVQIDNGVFYVVGWVGDGDPVEPDLIGFSENRGKRTSGKWKYEDKLEQLSRGIPDSNS